MEPVLKMLERFLKTLKIKLLYYMIQQFHFLVSIQRKSNEVLLKTADVHCSITHIRQVRESPADEGVRGRREGVLLGRRRVAKEN